MSQAVFAPSISIKVEGGSKGEEADRKAGQSIGKEVQRAIRAEVAAFISDQMRPGAPFGPGGRRRNWWPITPSLRRVASTSCPAAEERGWALGAE